MAQAPDFETVYDVETAIENAVATEFGNAPDSMTVHKSRATSSKTAPYVNIQCLLGEETGKMTQDNAGTFRNCAWNFSLLVGVVTNRADDAGTHADWRARARKILADWVARLTELNSTLDYHVIGNVEGTGTSLSVDNENDLDISVLEFAGHVSVRSDAWPA